MTKVNIKQDLNKKRLRELKKAKKKRKLTKVEFEEVIKKILDHLDL